MLCNTCESQKNCIPYLLAKDSPQLVKMLENLKECELQKLSQKGKSLLNATTQVVYS